jgi:hypothetical protein
LRTRFSVTTLQLDALLLFNTAISSLSTRNMRSETDGTKIS